MAIHHQVTEGWPPPGAYLPTYPHDHQLLPTYLPTCHQLLTTYLPTYMTTSYCPPTYPHGHQSYCPPTCEATRSQSGGMTASIRCTSYSLPTCEATRSQSGGMTASIRCTAASRWTPAEAGVWGAPPVACAGDEGEGRDPPAPGVGEGVRAPPPTQEQAADKEVAR